MITIPERSEALKEAQKKYVEKIARVEITMSREKRQRLQDHTEKTGESISGFVNRAIDETIARDSMDNDPGDPES